jgi:hypothetical protein
MKAETLSWSSGFPSARGRIRPQDVAKIVQMSDMAKKIRKFFLWACPSAGGTTESICRHFGAWLGVIAAYAGALPLPVVCHAFGIIGGTIADCHLIDGTYL